MRLRTFNESGIRAFRTFLRKARQDPTTPAPSHIVEDETLTKVYVPAVEVEPRRFGSRAEAADYFCRLFKQIPSHQVANDASLWTWLSSFFFDEVCPRQRGRRKVMNDYCYIYEPRNPHNSYRHRLYIAWRIITAAPQHNRLFLRAALPTLDQVTAEVFKRLYLTRIPCIFEILDRLYWDDSQGKARAGIVTRKNVKPGDLIHRLPIRIQQLERTYDLMTLSADQLLDLLGEEFRQYDSDAAVTN